MKLADIQKKAKGLGINGEKMQKTDLIHAIQSAEGYPQCYATSKGKCPYVKCCFMSDCLKIK